MTVDINELRQNIAMYGLEATCADDLIEPLDCLEAAEKETASWKGLAKQFGNEADALRAKVEQMEKQEPVAWLHETRRDSDVVTDAVKHVWGKVAVGSMAAYSIPLYALPGAQHAPSIRMAREVKP